MLYFMDACVKRIFWVTTDSMASRNWSAVHDGAFSFVVVLSFSNFELNRSDYTVKYEIHSKILRSVKSFYLLLTVLGLLPSTSSNSEDSECAFGSIQWKPCKFCENK